MTNHGYSTRLIAVNMAADVNNIGVALGWLCMHKDISVIEVAKELGVTRQTVYNWFTGRVTPPPKTEIKIRAFIDRLNKGES